MPNNEKKLYTNRLQSGVFDYFSQIASSNKFTYTLSESVIQLIDEASTIAEKNIIFSISYQVGEDPVTNDNFLENFKLIIPSFEDILRYEPFTHTVLLYRNETKSFDQFIDEMTIYIEKHRVSTIFKSLSPDYGRWSFVSPYDFLIYKMLTVMDLSALESVMARLLAAGLSESMMINRMLKSEYHFDIISPERLEELLIRFKEQESNVCKRFLLVLFIVGCKDSSRIRSYRRYNINSSVEEYTLDLNKSLLILEKLDLIDLVKTIISSSTVSKKLVAQLNKLIA